MRPVLPLMIVGAILYLFQGLAQAQTNTISQTIADSVISTKITTKFTKNHLLNPLKIRVSTDHAVVTLYGNVKNKEAFVEALRLVKTTQGVQAINTDNLMISRVNTSFTDAYITAKVEAAVLTAKVLDDESIPIVGINATTSNGTVTLSGTVKKDKSVADIIKRVNAVQGVKKIISRLQTTEQG